MAGGTDDPAPTVTPGELVAPTVAAEPGGARDPDASRLPFVGREHYAVEGEFARGGMGRILLARDRRLGRTVALKELQAAAAPDAATLRARGARHRAAPAPGDRAHLRGRPLAGRGPSTP